MSFGAAQADVSDATLFGQVTFDAEDVPPLTLVETRPFRNGVVLLRYRRRSEPGA